MDQGADVVFEEFRLGRANPAGDAAQEFGQQHEPGYEGDQKQDGADALPGATGAQSRHQAIHQQARQVDRGHW